ALPRDSLPEGAWNGICLLWAKLAGSVDPEPQNLATALAAHINAGLEGRASRFEGTVRKLADKRAFAGLWRLLAKREGAPLTGEAARRLLTEAPLHVLVRDTAVTASLLETLRVSGVSTAPLWSDTPRCTALCAARNLQRPVAALMNDCDAAQEQAIAALIEHVGRDNDEVLAGWLDRLTPGGPVYLASAAAWVRRQVTGDGVLTVVHRVWKACEAAGVAGGTAGLLLGMFGKLRELGELHAVGMGRPDSSPAPLPTVPTETLVNWHLRIMHEPAAADGGPGLCIARWLVDRKAFYAAHSVLLAVAPVLRANPAAHEALVSELATVAQGVCRGGPGPIGEYLDAARDLLDAAPRVRRAWRQRWERTHAIALFTALRTGHERRAHAFITRLLDTFVATSVAEETLSKRLGSDGAERER
ncbi:MAG TPA: hypothetical protein VFH51_03705, partial [Myxococcota bacterium]|nr:hypothetical protein [Myxococcota bacterium]